MPLTNYAFADLITFTRASTGTFVGRNGLIQTAAINTPRFDFDPVTLAPLGLLIEEQRTNLMLYSQEFDNAAWTKTDATVTTNAATSPDGTSSADKLVATAVSTNAHQVGQTVNFVAGTAYSMTCYMRAGEYAFGNLLLPSAAFTSNQVGTFDLTNGLASVSVGTPTVSISNAGNGWWRVSIVATATTTAAGGATIRVNSTYSNNVYTGDGTSGIYVYGAQIEAGAFATSYIPTVAAQVTRSRDAVSMTGTDFSNWYNSNQGTFIASFTVRQSSVVLVANDGTFNNRLPQMSIGSVSGYENFIVAGGTVVATLNPAGTHTFGTTANVSVAYAVNNYAAVANGGTVVTDTSGALPTGINALNIGSFQNGSTPMNGYLRSIIYYPTRLTDAQLQALTL